MILYNGQPVPVLSIQPNWNASIELAENYDDIIREALNHGEERLGIKPRADYGIRFDTLTLSARETGYLRKILELSESLPVAVPFWQDACYLSKDAPAGNPFVECDPTDGAMFDVFPFVMVWQSFSKFHTAKAAGVGPAQVWFDDALPEDYQKGDRVVPVSLGNIRRDNAGALTDENSIFTVDFNEAVFPDPIQTCADITGISQYAQLPFLEICFGGPPL